MISRQNLPRQSQRVLPRHELPRPERRVVSLRLRELHVSWADALHDVLCVATRCSAFALDIGHLEPPVYPSDVSPRPPYATPQHDAESAPDLVQKITLCACPARPVPCRSRAPRVDSQMS